MVVQQSPSESASTRRRREGWTDTAMLLAQVIDALNVLAWQQTEDGAKNRNHPEPIPRPGVKSRAEKDVIGKSDGMTFDELAAWYAGRFKQQPPQD